MHQKKMQNIEILKCVAGYINLTIHLVVSMREHWSFRPYGIILFLLLFIDYDLPNLVAGLFSPILNNSEVMIIFREKLNILSSLCHFVNIALFSISSYISTAFSCRSHWWFNYNFSRYFLQFYGVFRYFLAEYIQWPYSFFRLNH